MSVQGFPSKDLCVSNLVVSDTLVATNATTLNAKVDTLNKVPIVSLVIPFFSVFTGKELGQLAIVGSNFSIYLVNEVNDGPDDPLPAGTPFAVIDPDLSRVLYQVDNDVYFSGFLYNSGAPTIDTAGTEVTIVIGKNGQISCQSSLPKKGTVLSTGQTKRIPGTNNAPCAAGLCLVSMVIYYHGSNITVCTCRKCNTFTD